MYFDLQNQNLKQVFVGWHRKSPTIRKKDIVIKSHGIVGKHGKQAFWVRNRELFCQKREPH